MLRDSAVFSDNFSETVLQQTVPLIMEQRYTPEQVIYHEGDLSDSSIYFIQKGSVEVFIDLTGNSKVQRF